MPKITKKRLSDMFPELKREPPPILTKQEFQDAVVGLHDVMEELDLSPRQMFAAVSRILAQARSPKI